MIVLLTAQSITAITYPVNDNLQWSDYSWQLDDTQVNNVWVDNQGNLHMKLQKIDNKWRGSTIESDFTVKYGKLTWVASSPSLNLERNTTIGLFTYYDDLHEIDIEINQWPEYDQHLWFTNQPGDIDDNPQNINCSIFSNDPHLNEKNITYTIDWKPTYILFSAVASDGTVLSQWNYTNAGAIPQVNSSICMDITCLGDTGCPASGNPSEIVFESFSYIPYE